MNAAEQVHPELHNTPGAPKTTLYPEHAAVTLKSELKYQGKVLPAGTVGAIISVHSDHAVYTVEFIAEGESLLPELSHTDIEPAAERSRHG